MTDDRQHSARPQAAGEDVRLSKAVEREVGQLVRHPIVETRRLREEVRAGEHGSVLFVVVGGVAIWLWCVSGLMMLAAFLAAHFATR